MSGLSDYDEDAEAPTLQIIKKMSEDLQLFNKQS
jgi:hypothetical protein